MCNIAHSFQKASIKGAKSSTFSFKKFLMDEGYLRPEMTHKVEKTVFTWVILV